MSAKTLIGLVGTKTSTDKVLKALQKYFNLPVANSVGDIYEQGVELIKPKKFKGLISETEIRQLSQKLGASISVTKFSGKKVETESESTEYLAGLANQFGSAGWAAKLFLDTDFFRRASGKYVALVTRQEDSDLLKKDMGLDYRSIRVYDNNESKPDNEAGAYIVVGESTGKELKERIERALNKLENKGAKK